MARAQRTVGESNHSNSFRALKKLADRVSFGKRSHARILALVAPLRAPARLLIGFLLLVITLTLLLEHTQSKLAHRLGHFLVAGEIAQVLD